MTPPKHPNRVPGVSRARQWVLVVLAVVTVAFAVVYFTPVLGVRSVRVENNRSLHERTVASAAGVKQGTSMLRVDLSEIEERLERIPKVQSAHAALSWPSTVRLHVTEREAVAFSSVNGRFQLVDATGLVFQTVPQSPDLPEIRVARVAPEDESTRAAMTVLRSLKPSVRAETAAVIAETPRYVRLLLDGDREVEWGSPDQSARKAAILPPLLTRPGKMYDVTSPALPTVA